MDIRRGKEYLGSLYKNSNDWSKYTKREGDMLRSMVDRLIETTKLPIDDKVIARQFHVDKDDVTFARDNGEYLKYMVSTVGKVDRSETKRILDVLNDNFNDILLCRQVGESPGEFVPCLQIPYDYNVWLKYAKKVQATKHVDLTSNQNIEYYVPLLDEHLKTVDDIYKESSLFRNKLDVSEALIEGGYEVTEYLSREELIELYGEDTIEDFYKEYSGSTTPKVFKYLSPLNDVV